ETQPDDTGLNDLQLVSDTRNISIGVGIPTKKEKGICISMILFQPYSPRKMYSKKYLHPDEDEFFVRGENFSSLKIKDLDITFAICYEISVAEHLDQAVKSGSKIYIASVAKFTNGIDKALKTLSATAGKYAMTVLMSNCVGQCDGQECGGKSSIWNNRGSLMGQLDNTNEGILVLDVETGEVISETM
ncbi:MAG TPA: nitrilase-related carbon-nitrogen hydrolase, partial [Cyclobacteriaceae bacterium]|nr:nitrilase-related carbon-nitrogen hydrolase [Cyclobacteriaceae bacterium]